MIGKLRLHWKFTTFLFAVGFIEFIIVALYLSVDLQPSSPLKAQNSSYAVLGIRSAASQPIEMKQSLFGELFNEGSGIEKRLPKLLHDYFKEHHIPIFSPAELVGLFNFEMGQ